MSPHCKLADVIELALNRCGEFLQTSNWQGRENELVNLFALHCLASEIRESGPLCSLAQIGIEVAVPQVTTSSKRYVRKDLVIWPEPLMTAWSGSPAIIIEWKRDNLRECGPDIEWLSLFTRRFPGTIGYSVCGFVVNNRGLQFTRIEKGAVTRIIDLRR